MSPELLSEGRFKVNRNSHLCVWKGGKQLCLEARELYCNEKNDDFLDLVEAEDV